jgi:hypothetical protein
MTFQYAVLIKTITSFVLMCVKIQPGTTVRIGVDNALREYYEFTCGGVKLQHCELGRGKTSFTCHCNSEQLTTIFRSKYTPSDNPLAT